MTPPFRGFGVSTKPGAVHFRGLLTHLATLPRNDLRYGDTGRLIPTLTLPTDTQRRAFELLGTPIPLTLK